jgi:hypothetical protein
MSEQDHYRKTAEMNIGDIVFAYIPFRFRSIKYFKFRKVIITGIGGNGNFNIVPVSKNHSFAVCFKENQLSTDIEFCTNHNIKVDNIIRNI